MATTAINSTTDAFAGTGVNPKSVLGKDDFMKLLLTELQHQDPTSPMDSDKILSQTSQLAQLESQDKTNKALEALSASLANSKDFAAVSSIGKYAKLESSLALTHDTKGKPNPIKFELEFAENIKDGSIKIYDEKSHLVKTINIEEGDKGKHKFTWNGLNDAGEKAKGGSYNVVADYHNKDGVKLKGEFGSHKIDSVKFDSGKTYLKLDGTFVDFSHVTEIYDKEDEKVTEEKEEEKETEEA